MLLKMEGVRLYMMASFDTDEKSSSCFMRCCELVLESYRICNRALWLAKYSCKTLKCKALSIIYSTRSCLF